MFDDAVGNIVSILLNIYFLDNIVFFRSIFVLTICKWVISKYCFLLLKEYDMLTNLRGVSPLSEAMSDAASERNRVEKALLTKTPVQSQIFLKPNTAKNYSDKNGNDVTKNVKKGRKTFVFWTIVCLLFILAIGNLVLTFTILAVLRLGQGKIYFNSYRWYTITAIFK